MEFWMDINIATSCNRNMMSQQAKLNQLYNRLESVSYALKSTDDEAIRILSKKLQKQSQNISAVSSKMKRLNNGLERVIQVYDQYEEKINGYESSSGKSIYPFIRAIPLDSKILVPYVPCPAPQFDWFRAVNWEKIFSTLNVDGSDFVY